MLLDNDTIVTPNWLIQLCQCLYSDDFMGAVSPITNQNTFDSYIEEQINTIDDIYNYAINHTAKNIGIWERRIHLVGYAMLIKREVLNKVGVLDERFYPAGNEDDDISFRILEAGYHLSLCKDTFIYHFNSESMKRDSLSEQNIVIENEHKFKEKCGFASRYSSFVRNEIIEKIVGDTDLPIKVLEVGCACGATLLQIKNIYKNAELYGIELNEYAAKIANNFSEVLVGNVETLKLDYKELSFDYIIFADVLEYFNDPYSILTKFRKYLKKIVAYRI